MKKLWSDRAWDDYLYWQMQDLWIIACKGHYEE